MINIQKLILRLVNMQKKHGGECSCYAYEGESIGLVIRDGRTEVDFIPCSENPLEESTEPIEVSPKYVYIVEDKGTKSDFKLFSERYQVFTDSEKAIKHAKSLGFESMFGINLAIGHLNMYSCGDVNVSILTLEVKE